MSAVLDNAYATQRRRLTSTAVATSSALWVRERRRQREALRALLSIVGGAQAQTVAMTDAYMAAKAQSAGQPARVKGLDARLYTVARLRGKPADEVYSRPWGALGGQLDQGAEFAAALGSATATLGRLVSTDIQLAQTHAARDWMTGEDRIVGYNRVLSPGKNCELCIAASTRLYHREDLMPIHEHCGCSVSPVYGEPRELSPIDSAVRVGADDELGPRLLAEGWEA